MAWARNRLCDSHLATVGGWVGVGWGGGTDGCVNTAAFMKRRPGAPLDGGRDQCFTDQRELNLDIFLPNDKTRLNIKPKVGMNVKTPFLNTS